MASIKTFLTGLSAVQKRTIADALLSACQDIDVRFGTGTAELAQGGRRLKVSATMTSDPGDTSIKVEIRLKVR